MEHFMTSVMTSHGYLALIILAFVQACCIPVSSEITFTFSGLIAATPGSKFSLIGVIVIGIVFELAGSTTAYLIGRRGGRHLLERYGKWVLITHHDLDRAERMFAGRGAWVVAVLRCLPVVRCFAGFGAGVVEVPIVPFSIYNLIGTAAWVTGLTTLGYQLGPTVNKYYHSFSVIGGVLVGLLLVGLIAHRVRALMKERRQGADAHDSEPGEMPRRVSQADHDGFAQTPRPSAKSGDDDPPQGRRRTGAHRAGPPR